MKKDSNTKEVVRKRKASPILVIVLGVILGGALIGLGIYNNLNSDYDAMNIKSEEELVSERDEKLSAYEELREKRQEEYNKSALSEDYEKMTRELSAAEDELLDIEAELYNVQSGKYEGTKKEKYLNSVPLIAFGAVVIIFALGLAMKMSTSSKKNVILTITEEK